MALASFERSPIAEVAPELFGYLVESVQQSWILPDRQVQLVIAALPVAQQAEAVRQLAAARQSIGDQAALLDEYQPLAEGGSADRGRTLYFGKATCSTCHRVGNEGGVIGPDLTKVGAIRTARDLVESLVVPSATIAQRYETYTVITDAGRVFTGVLARQTPELVVLHDASGAELRIRTRHDRRDGNVQAFDHARDDHQDARAGGSPRSAGVPAESKVTAGAWRHLTALVDYETYTVITDAGRVFTGVLARQTPELVVLHDASGAELRIRTGTIDEMEMSKRSIMPETTIKTLVREEVRDLLAFLQSLK